MAANDHLGRQFRQVTLPDVGHTNRTYQWQEPVPKEGHTRLYRFTDGGPRGHYAERPLTGFGYSMYHADIPSDQVEQHRRGEHKSFLLDPKEHPAGTVKSVNWETENKEGRLQAKPYEMSDYDEYNKTWPRHDS